MSRTRSGQCHRGERVLWKLCLEDPQFGSLGYDGHHGWSLLQGKYPWRCSGTRCGTGPSGKVTVLANFGIVALDGLPSSDALLLDTFADRTSERVWTLSAASLLSALDRGHALDEFRRYVDRAPPRNRRPEIDGLVPGVRWYNRGVVVAMTVWVDDWQMQCCGTPFAVGDDVSWTVHEPDRDFFAELFGSQDAVGIDAAEEHHVPGPEAWTVMGGRVTGIDAVHCRYAVHDSDGSLRPVPGSARRTPVSSADGWNAAQGEHRFVGYLVRLAVPESSAS